jgi:hypothetical protein
MESETFAPKSLYKYLPPARISVLESLLIRFSQASVMNDQLEFKPPVKGLSERKNLEEVITARFELKFPGRIGLIRSVLPAYEAEELIQTCISHAADQAESNLEQSMSKIYEINSGSFGILSLAEAPDCCKMWNLYTDCGKGFVIEFDASHPWFWQKREEADDLRHLRPVHYVDNRPAAYLLDLDGQDYLYTKEAKWAYEREWRIILNFNDAAGSAGKDDSEADVMLFAIPPDCIKSVILGYGTTNEDADKILRVISSTSTLAHVQLNRSIRGVSDSIEITADGAATA